MEMEEDKEENSKEEKVDECEPMKVDFNGNQEKEQTLKEGEWRCKE
jgi:hypothetical protein